MQTMQTLATQAITSISKQMTPLNGQSKSVSITSREHDEKLKLRTITLLQKFKYVWSAQAAPMLYDLEAAGELAQEWYDSLRNLTDEQCYKAFKMLKNTSKFMPSISEFKRAALDILDEEIAYQEYCACMHKDVKSVNDIVERCRKLIPGWDYNNLPEKTIKPRFIAFYKKLVQEALSE